MRDRETFEEKVSEALDALYDGADLLTGEPARAEALVIGVVVEAARAAHPPPLEPEDFRTWILGRLVRHYLDYIDASGDAEPRPAASVPDPAAAPAREETGALVEGLNRLDASAPGRLGELIRGAMGELPVRERAAMWLVDVMEFGYADAARSLGIRLRVLRETLYRARRDLQLRLGAALREEGGTRPTERANGGA